MSEPQKTLEDVKAAYRQLGLEFGASEDAVKKKYRELALKEHPDKNPGNAEAAARFDKIQKAKELLDKYTENPKYFARGPPQRATSFDPFDTHIPSRGNARSVEAGVQDTTQLTAKNFFLFQAEVMRVSLQLIILAHQTFQKRVSEKVSIQRPFEWYEPIKALDWDIQQHLGVTDIGKEDKEVLLNALKLGRMVGFTSHAAPET
ncbi:hypothetical protein ACEPAI_151 [Sanghuangporus weigelae]